MIKVGITGNIGSGKTTVCKIFERLGIPIYNADQRAKTLMNTDPHLAADIKYYFGPLAYIKGKLNRKFLASVAFSDSSKLMLLNQIVHPAVAQDSARWFEKQSTPYAIKEAALLIESKSYKNLDKLILVKAPTDIRLRRVAQRDGLTPSAIRARMDKQLPESEQISFADFVIENDGKHLLIPQVWKIHKKLSDLDQKNQKKGTKKYSI